MRRQSCLTHLPIARGWLSSVRHVSQGARGTVVFDLVQYRRNTFLRTRCDREEQREAHHHGRFHRDPSSRETHWGAWNLLLTRVKHAQCPCASLRYFPRPPRSSAPSVRGPGWSPDRTNATSPRAARRSPFSPPPRSTPSLAPCRFTAPSPPSSLTPRPSAR